MQRLLLLQSMGSRMSGPQELRHLGSVIMAPGLGCSSACGTRGRTGVPCIARQILNYWATREAPDPSFVEPEAYLRAIF